MSAHMATCASERHPIAKDGVALPRPANPLPLVPPVSGCMAAMAGPDFACTDPAPRELNRGSGLDISRQNQAVWGAVGVENETLHPRFDPLRRPIFQTFFRGFGRPGSKACHSAGKGAAFPRRSVRASATFKAGPVVVDTEFTLRRSACTRECSGRTSEWGMQSRPTKVAELSQEASGCCVRCRVVAVIVAAQMGSGEGGAVSCSEVLVGDVSANPNTRDLPRQTALEAAQGQNRWFL